MNAIRQSLELHGLPTIESEWAPDAIPSWAMGLLSLSPNASVWLTGTLWGRWNTRKNTVTLGSVTEHDPHPALLR